MIDARHARIEALVEELTSQRAEDRIGETVEVLVEEWDEDDPHVVTGRAAHQGPEVDGVCQVAYADPSGRSAVGSLILWHFVEEIEHKRVTYDAFHALDGRYWMRIWGYLRATAHIMSRTRQGYRALLIEDGLWRSWRSRIALAAMLGRIFLRLAPRMLRVLRPGYDPREIKDPGWARAWQRLHNERPDMSGVLDMRRLAEPIPHLLELS